MKKLPNLNGLRFILASLVVLFHIPQFCQNRGFPFFNFLSIFHKGEEAVFMFFSLSGFLIVRQLYIEKSTYNFIHLSTFFKRRILRILPVYYLVLSFGLLYYRVILPYFGFDFPNNYDLIPGLFFAYTVFPNIFATFAPGGIIEVLWSIGIEEQFYLLIAPLLFIIPSKHLVRFLLFFTLGYFIIYFSQMVVELEKYKMLFFYFSFSGACSVLSFNNKINLQKFSFSLFLLLLLYFATAVFKNNLSDMFYHLFSMILFGLLLVAFSEKPLKIMENKFLNYLGKISYGIYMYHAIAMQIIGFLFLKLDLHSKIESFYAILIFNLLVFGLSIGTAHLSYRYYESYFLNLKKFYKS